MKKPLMIFILFFCSFFSQGQTIINRGAQSAVNNSSQSDTTSVHALIIGISKYADNSINSLKYADADAQVFRQYVEKYYKGRKINIKYLVNQDANAIKIAQMLREINNDSKANDLVIIYFAGHGMIDKSIAYLLCHDARKEYVGLGGSISKEYLIGAIKDFELKKVKTMLIIDACHSGIQKEIEGFKSDIGKIPSNIKLFSSQKNQSSLETQDLCNGHGYFTYYLIKGLMGEADSDKLDMSKVKNKKITVQELRLYLMNVVTNATGGKQEPQILTNENDEDEKLTIGAQLDNVEGKDLNCILGKGGTFKKEDSYTYSPEKEKEKIKDQLNSVQDKIYKQFLVSLEKKQFFEPTYVNTMSLYQQLKNEKINSTILSKITTEWQIAFKEFAQNLIVKYLQNGKIPVYTEFEKGANALKTLLEYKYDNPNNTLTQIEQKDYKSKYVFLDSYALHRKYSQYLLNISENERVKLYNDKIKIIQNEINSNPSEAYLYNVLGRFYKAINQSNKAESAYKQASILAPDWALPQWNLIDIDRVKNDNTKLKEFKGINIKYPNFIDGYLSIAYLLMTSSKPNYEESKIYLDKALTKAQELKEDSSMFASIYNYYGILYENKKNNSEAENYYKLALSWSKGYFNTASRNLCDLIMDKENRLDDAFSYVNQSLKLHPDNSELLLRLGKLYEQKSKNYFAKKDTLNANSNADKALANYLRSVELDSRFTDGYRSLIEYYRLRNRETTLKYAKIVVEVASTELEKKEYKIYYAYLLWENKKDHDECLKILNEILNDMRQNLKKSNSSITNLSDNLVFTFDDIPLIEERIKSNHYELYYVMGNVYQEGIGVTKNDAVAMKWYKWSLQSGFEPAASKIEKLYANNIRHTDYQIIRLKKNQNTKQFSVPCLMEGSTEKKSFKFFTNDYPDNEAEPIAEEIDRLKFIYKATIPIDVITAFSKLFKIARENNVSYGDLAEYALKSKPDDTKKRSETNNQKKDEYTTNVNISTVEGKSKVDIIRDLEREFIDDVNKYQNDFQRGIEKFTKNIVNATTFEEEVKNYYKIGLLYETSPTDKSNGKAIKWYNYAFQMGYDLAYKRLSNLYRFISESKVDWLNKTYQKGFASYSVYGTDAKGKSVKKTVYISEYPINPENPLEREQERLQDVYGVSINQIGLDFFKTHYNESQAKKDSFLDNVKDAVVQNSNKEDAEKPENIFEKGRQELLKAKPDFDVAIGYLKKAISLDNSKANYHFLYAYCLLVTKSYEQSEKSFKKAIELDPDRGTFYTYLGGLYITIHQYSKAQPVYEKAYILGENKNSGLCYNLACIHSLEKRTYNALRFLEEALQNGFNDFEHIKKDADLDNIRNEDRFKELIAKYQNK